MSAEAAIRAELVRAARALGAGEEVDPVLERPRNPAHGDWATNLAMTLARRLRQKPTEIAKRIVAAMRLADAGVAEATVAGAGFINFHVAAGALAGELATILEQGDAFGRADVGRGARVNVEFVSANPTGPLHVGHGRQAALGDAIAALLEYTGWRVTREFYYNDGGAQIQNLVLSVQARLRALAGAPLAIPDGGYHGEYIGEIAARYHAAHPSDARGDDLDAMRRFAVLALRAEQDLDLRAFGVTFDVYSLESALYTSGKVEETMRQLVRAGHTYERDGALWLRTTDFGDDKDRVMRRSAGKGGEYTYFVPDVAYHVSKWERGFHRAIDVQGSDHHSTVTRVRVGLQALEMGITPGYPEYVLHQMVTVMKGGAEMKISKRAGSYVTVRDLVDEVGRDAVRYFFLMRKGESPLVFDVDLARSQSEENPVYYVQMAHARLCGIFRVGDVDSAAVTAEGTQWDRLVEPEERALVKALLDWPPLVRDAAEALEPHRVAAYLLEMAQLVHLWYHKHHVLVDDRDVMRARLALANAARIVLRNALSVLGISAPERM
ncbi:MAG TPA: arginine--tRNA ligase [Gemmatimonadaceae bacterium]|nr:arginine--tRNA ligase [Gemmatimonadaceae bacterium]